MAKTGFTLTWRGDQVKAKSRDAAVTGLTMAAEHLLGEARRVVPIEEGTLERSGRSQVDAGNLTAAVGFDTRYAWRQHEETGWKHDAGRMAKYLEKPLQREAATMLALMAAAQRRALR